jgi:hypothetical protein
MVTLKDFKKTKSFSELLAVKMPLCGNKNLKIHVYVPRHHSVPVKCQVVQSGGKYRESSDWKGDS